jgi:hypothetical protein
MGVAPDAWQGLSLREGERPNYCVGAPGHHQAGMTHADDDPAELKIEPAAIPF